MQVCEVKEEAREATEVCREHAKLHIESSSKLRAEVRGRCEPPQEYYNVLQLLLILITKKIIIILRHKSIMDFQT